MAQSLEKLRAKGYRRGQRSAEELASQGHTGPVHRTDDSPRTSHRWVGKRTKGQPYSRCVLKEVIPAGGKGHPAVLCLAHPTRGGIHRKRATPALLKTFFSGLPKNLEAHMLGAV